MLAYLWMAEFLPFYNMLQNWFRLKHRIYSNLGEQWRLRLMKPPPKSAFWDEDAPLGSAVPSDQARLCNLISLRSICPNRALRTRFCSVRGFLLWPSGRGLQILTVAEILVETSEVKMLGFWRCNTTDSLVHSCPNVLSTGKGRCTTQDQHSKYWMTNELATPLLSVGMFPGWSLPGEDFAVGGRGEKKTL